MAFDRRLFNVVLLGLAFMLIFTAFQTMGNIQKTIIESIKQDNEKKNDTSFQGDGYVSLSIIYAVMSILNWAAPSVISVIGPNFAMLFGGITYVLFIMSFLIPRTWLLYLASVIIGTGAAVIWTGQGNYLTLNSTQATVSRNSGIFWAMLQLSMFIGNLFVYFKFKGLDSIDVDTRNMVIWTLSGIGIAGLVVMVLLPRPKKTSQIDIPDEVQQTPLEALKGAVKLFFTKDMLLLSITFFYTGIELGFFSGVYSSCIGFTQKFSNPKELVGLSGILIGLGEVLGGAAFGILGSKTIKWGRDPIVIAGFIVHVISFFLIFLNLPNNSPFSDTTDGAIITSSPELAIFCSFLLGFGDSCFNTQIYSILGGVYSNNSASAFAIFKFTQSVAAAICFGYSTGLILYGQLGILLVLAICGTASFVMVEWKVKKEALAKSVHDNASSEGSEKAAF
ncbi:UNC93-like protein MFSD11 [Tribolium madens]|uniref:UNC93-like protein MFSD11 n=1 Tax=Tribolium madens TaxID=41895 RepID=UPI001CF7308B|nr:UNC93-like protein MFSD11 [Tribolium madens]